MFFSLSISVQKNGQLHLPHHHDYYHQIQGQLHLTKKSCADLVIWTTKSVEVVRINREDQWKENIDRMIDFYFSKFIPCVTENN